MNPTRIQYLQGVRTAVIKLGTQLLSDADGRLEGVVHLHDLWRTQMF